MYVLGVVVVLYGIWLVLLYLAQDALVFPARFAGAPLLQPLPGAELMTLEIAPGQKVEAWFFAPRPGASIAHAAPSLAALRLSGHREIIDPPAAGTPAAHRAPTIIFFHGNAELIDHQWFHVEPYLQMGFAVLVPEYRGYGRSPGRPSQATIGADMVRFYDALVQRPDVDRSRIIFHGRSIGAAIAADLASKRKPAAMILESGPANVTSFAARFGAPSFLVTNPFRTDRVLPTLGIPMLLMHGSHDGIIPVSNGRKLHELVPGSTYIELDADHNDFPGQANVGAYWQAIAGFLRERLTP